MKTISLWQAMATAMTAKNDEEFFQSFGVIERKMNKIMYYICLVLSGGMFLSAFRFISWQDALFRITIGAVLLGMATMLKREQQTKLNKLNKRICGPL